MSYIVQCIQESIIGGGGYADEICLCNNLKCDHSYIFDAFKELISNNLLSKEYFEGKGHKVLGRMVKGTNAFEINPEVSNDEYDQSCSIIYNGIMVYEGKPYYLILEEETFVGSILEAEKHADELRKILSRDKDLSGITSNITKRTINQVLPNASCKRLINKKEINMSEVHHLTHWLPSLKMDAENEAKVIYGIPKGQKSLLMEDMSQAGNVLIYGSSGSGKSIFLHTFILSNSLNVPSDSIRLILVDPKQVEFFQYKDSGLLLCPIIENKEQFLKEIRNLLKECKRREKLLSDGDGSLYSSRKLPFIVMAIDEYAAFEDQRIDKVLQDVLKSGPKVGVHVLLATQRVDILANKMNLLENFETIVCQRNSNEKITKKLFGEVQKLDEHGDSLILHNGKIDRCQGLLSYCEYSKNEFDEKVHLRDLMKRVTRIVVCDDVDDVNC